MLVTLPMLADLPTHLRMQASMRGDLQRGRVREGEAAGSAPKRGGTAGQRCQAEIRV